MKKKSLLFSAAAMVLVSLVAVTGVTFAWFSAARNPSVNQIDAKVTSSGSLLIATNYSGTYKPNLTFREILDANQHLEDISLNAVTPKAGPDKKVIAANEGVVAFASGMEFSDELFKAWYIDDNNILDPQGLEQDADYIIALEAMRQNPNLAVAGQFYDYVDDMPPTLIAFTLYFRASEDMDIYLDLPETENALNGTYFNSKDRTLGSNNTNTVAQQDLQYSLRAGFVSGAPSSNGAIAAGQAMTIYDPYQTHAALQGDLLGDKGGGNIIEGLYDSIQYSTSLPRVEGVLRIKIGTCNKATGEYPDVTGIRIYIWVEGNDLDNTSFVAGGNFAASLRFYGELTNP